jgi:hypothetical protein
MFAFLVLGVLIFMVAAGVYLKMYPQMPRSFSGYENFANPAVAPEEPNCIRRSLDAQALASLFKQCSDQRNAPTEDDMDRAELNLILQKLTCLDADVSNNGTNGYNTLKLQYNTSHDAEPLQNFVGRCLNNGTRSRDLEIMIDLYERRGNTIVKQLCSRAKIDAKEPLERYAEVIKTTMKTLTLNCLMKHTSLDRPYGVRDPGFSSSYMVDKLAPY